MFNQFRVYFRRRRQYFDVFLWDVHPNTFASWDAGRWAYVDFTGKEHPRKGKFADLHLVKSRLRHDVIRHELDHIRINWMFNGDGSGERQAIITPFNEEWFCEFGDELENKFWREYAKHNKSK